MIHGAAELALPTVTGFAARQAVAMLRVQDCNRAATACSRSIRAGLRSSGDGSPTSHRVSAQAQAKFLDCAAEAMDDSAFGLHLAEQTDPRDAGILFYVASVTPTIGEALTLLARYFRIVNEAVRMKLMRTPVGVAVEVEFVALPTHTVRQNAEFGMAVLLRALRELAGETSAPPEWRLRMLAIPTYGSSSASSAATSSSREPRMKARHPTCSSSQTTSSSSHSSRPT